MFTAPITIIAAMMERSPSEIIYIYTFNYFCLTLRCVITSFELNYAVEVETNGILPSIKRIGVVGINI